MDEAASVGVPEQAGRCDQPVKKRKGGANWWICDPRKGPGRYRFLKPQPDGIHFEASERALLAIIEAGEEKGGFTRAELVTAVKILIPTTLSIPLKISKLQRKLIKYGCFRYEYDADKKTVDSPAVNGNVATTDNP